MEWNLTDKEFESVVRLGATERYEYFVKKVVDEGCVWSLASDEGWVLSHDDEGRECVPVWPHYRYAEACAVGEWANTRPEAIDLHAWIEKWLPGIEGDDRLISVFSTPKLNAVIVSHSEMRDDLGEELSDYE